VLCTCHCEAQAKLSEESAKQGLEEIMKVAASKASPTTKLHNVRARITEILSTAEIHMTSALPSSSDGEENSKVCLMRLCWDLS
jgi:hypothetical protein